MNSVYDVIQTLKATNSRNEKLEILKMVKKDELLEDVFCAVAFHTYDPQFNYHIKEFEKSDSHSGSHTLADSLNTLHMLNDRQVTGNAAKELVEETYAGLSEENADVFARIIDRNLNCGATASTINKVWPGLIYEHPYMRCSSYNEKNLKKISYPCYSQTKEDGLYVDIIVRDGKVTYMTRNGEILDINDPESDDKLAQHADGYVLQGEVLIKGETEGEWADRQTGNGVLNRDEIDFSRVYFFVWDIIPYQDFELKKCTKPYKERFSFLKVAVSGVGLDRIRVVDSRLVNSAQEIIDHFKENVEAGKEGTVVKNLSTVWKHGTSKDQVKVKIAFDCELEVVDFYEGKGKHEGRLGGMTCVSSDRKLQVNIGGGYSDKLREQIWSDVEAYRGAIVTVTANDVIKDRDDNALWSLFLPRLKEIRKDKNEADSFEQVLEQKEAFVKTLEVIE